MPTRSQEETDRDNSRTFLFSIVKILQGIYADRRHGEILMGRFYDGTRVAASKKKGVGADFRRNFSDALGPKEADYFLRAFNRCIRDYKKQLKQNEKNPCFRFENTRVKTRVIAALKKLQDSSKESRGFFIPYYGMGYPPRNTRRCTGR